MKPVAPYPSAPLSDAPEARLAARLGGLVCGVDEVGRGPLAGPVVAAAVILPPGLWPQGLADSKTLSARARNRLAPQICHMAIAHATAQASVAEIDRLNILQASLLAMRRAVAALAPQPVGAIVDGNRDPALGLETELLVKGDRQSAAVAAAAVIAKVSRDHLMCRLHADYPAYDWASNMGYGSPAHLRALKQTGVSPHHRKSFRPVAAQLTDRKSVV